MVNLECIITYCQWRYRRNNFYDHWPTQRSISVLALLQVDRRPGTLQDILFLSQQIVIKFKEATRSSFFKSITASFCEQVLHWFLAYFFILGMERWISFQAHNGWVQRVTSSQPNARHNCLYVPHHGRFACALCSHYNRHSWLWWYWRIKERHENHLTNKGILFYSSNWWYWPHWHWMCCPVLLGPSHSDTEVYLWFHSVDIWKWRFQKHIPDNNLFRWPTPACPRGS